MTAVTTRTPLQVVTNPNGGMSAPRRSTRRSGARLADDDGGSKAIASSDDAAAPASRRVDAPASKPSKRGATLVASSDRRGKRKLDYDEEDDGFAFKRTKSTRSKAANEQVPEPASEQQEQEPEPEPKQLEVRKRRKKSSEPPGSTAEPPAAVRRKEAPSTSTSGAATRHAKTAKPAKATGTKHASALASASAATAQRTPSPKRGGDVTKVALPFADTPVIRRNQEMRRGGGGDGSRRSSLSMRGRRASSLIESGTSNALPHAEVPTADFYKHIESGLPEPRRMKQLLTWCATRALGTKPSDSKGKSHARLAAYEIKEQILHDFSTQSSLSDWFGREDRPVPKQAQQPNPRNIANQAKIDELKKRLARLRVERETWEKLLSPSNDTPLIPSHPRTRPSPDTIDSTLLNDSDRDALSLLTSIHNTSNPDREGTDPSSHTVPTTAATTSIPKNTKHASADTAAASTSTSRPGTSTSPTPIAPSTLSSATATATTTTDTAPSSTAPPSKAPPIAQAAATATAQTIPARIAHIASTAEFAIDRLADAAHTLAQHLTHAERLGRRVLAGCAERLAARDRADGESERAASSARKDAASGAASGDEREEVGTRKVLMALSRVLDR